MKAYKIELLVIDFDNQSPEEITSAIENTNYGNHSINPKVKSVVTRDIGEWTDSHPLNLNKTCDAEYKRLFGVNS